MDEDASSSEPNNPILRDELMMTENGRKILKSTPFYSDISASTLSHSLSTT